MIKPSCLFPVDADGYVAFGSREVRDVIVAGKVVRQLGSVGAKLSNVLFEKLNVVFALGGGQVLTTLTECVFDRCVLKGPGGGGWLSFERCEFRDCTLRNMILNKSDFVGCTFSGKIINSVFCASLSPHEIRQGVKTKNNIVDNDFTDCIFAGVSFRGGVDLERQRLPAAQPGLLCVDGPAVIKALYERFVRGKGEADEWATCVRVLQEEVENGQHHLYLSPGSFQRTNIEPILSFLREKGLGREVP
jgi:hypothetical protein